MKRKSIFAITILSLSTIALNGCGGYKYKDKELHTLVYKDIDYLGGFTRIFSFYFFKNFVTLEYYTPWEEDAKVELIWTKNFTDEQESKLAKGLYSSGLYGIKDEYVNYNIIDGGGWFLNIAFTDGATIHSSGSNSSPRRIFEKCGPYFYEICGDGVVSYIG